MDRLGVGEFCLEVHSAKAQKSAVLGKLKQAWEGRVGETSSQWEEKADELDQLRIKLNNVVTALHQRRRNGLTAYAALGRVISGADWHPDLRLTFPSHDYHDQGSMRRLRELCGRIRIALGNVEEPSKHPLKLIKQTEWSPAWRSELGDAIAGFKNAALTYEAALPEVAQQLSNSLPDDPDSTFAFLSLAAQALDPDACRASQLMNSDTDELGRSLEKWLHATSTYDAALNQLSCRYRPGVFSQDFAKLLGEWRDAELANFVVRGGRKKKVWQALSPFTDSPQPNDVGAELAKLMDVAHAREKLTHLNEEMTKFGALWQGGGPDPSALAGSLDWVEETRRSLQKCANEGLDAQECLAGLQALLGNSSIDFRDGGPYHSSLKTLYSATQTLLDARDRIAQLAGTTSDLGIVRGNGWLTSALTEMNNWSSSLNRSQSWCSWQRETSEAAAEGLKPLMDALAQGRFSGDELSHAFELAYARWWVDRLIDSERPLREFMGSFHEDAIARFVKLDEEVSDLSKGVVVARLSRHIPPRSAFGDDPEWGTLSREIAKVTRQMPLRQLFSQTPKALTSLAPCMMMSPLSIAQFLPAETSPFDLVVFDEASQIPVWDAVGAIARGKQVVIVGDPKQLPPTTFFDKSDSGSDDVAEIEDLESILDECLAANIPHKRLNWHYRSHHESLIAFSNERYYDGRLVTFPSPVTDDRAVRYVHVAGAVYDRGGSRTNRTEADTLIADVVRRLLDPRFKVENSSLGIVTFNSEQQKLIENLLDQARRARPEIEEYFDPKWHEPVFVKNLESVQGDERDVILFSVAYGPDAAGHMTQNYGPLNLDGGTKRLNVAITRARSELVVFAALRPEQIDLSRAKGAGVRDFKHFLEFAQRGRRALIEAYAPTGREEDSEFERAIRRALEAKGWTVHTQVGASSFRIDLGVVHPDAPGRYLTAVECDGATYHRSATARDRDKLREAQLRLLGWRVRRVWSTDWWNDAARALAELQKGLEVDLAEQRSIDQENAVREEAQGASPTEATVMDSTVAGGGNTAEHSDLVTEKAEALGGDTGSKAKAEIPTLYAGQVEAADSGSHSRLREYRVADLTSAVFVADASQFYEQSYRPTLRKMVAHVVSTEGPIYDELLVRRLARFHGFQRAGRQIKELVLELVERRFPRSSEGERKVYWPEGSTRTMEYCRKSDPSVRDHNDTPDAELRALATFHVQSGATPEEAASLMAGDLGIGRLMKAARERFVDVAGRVARARATSD